jgi:DNA-binding NarL/FixJ family response regulator
MHAIALDGSLLVVDTRDGSRHPLQAAALGQAIKSAAAGQVQLTPRAVARLMQAVSATESSVDLTERETEILRLIARGQSNKQIARSLHISEKTVKTHVSNILTKLGVQSRTQATLFAIRIGRTSRPDCLRNVPHLDKLEIIAVLQIERKCKRY